MSVSSNFTPTKKTDSSQSLVQIHTKEPDHGPEQVQDSPFRFDVETADRSEICVSPTWNSNSTIRKEKRVTKRLEAERRELEKRLKNLEEAELTRNLISFKRESRRLTKKQPMRSSSRDSSISADRPRSSSSTFTSFFSGVRRESRSCSNSINGYGSDKALPRHQSTGSPRELQRCDDPDTQHRASLALALPERFGTAISKELAHKNNALLSSYIPSTSPQRSLHTTTKSIDVRECSRISQGTEIYGKVFQDDTEAIFPDNTTSISNAQSRAEDEIGKALTTNNASNEPLDLDRTLFAASLSTGKRASGIGHFHVGSSMDTTCHSHVPQKMSIQEGNIKSNMERPSTSYTTTRLQSGSQAQKDTNISKDTSNSTSMKTPSFSTVKGGSQGSLSIMESTDDVSQNHKKKFRPSPLSAVPTTNHGVDVNLEARGTNIPTTPKGLDTTKQAGTGPPTSSNLFKSSSKFAQQLASQYSKGENRKHLGSSFNDSQPPGNGSRAGSVTGSSWPTNGSLHTFGHRLKNKPVYSFDPDTDKGVQRPTTLTGSRPRNRSVVTASSRSHKSGVPRGILDSSCQDASQSLGRVPRHITLEEQAGVVSGSSSRSSSQADSEDYDTADEDLPGIFQSDAVPNDHLETDMSTTPLNDFDQKIQLFNANGTSCSVMSSPANFQAKKLVEIGKIHQQSQVIGKIFVICCRCKFWHDMPSEVYAKLACPDLSFNQLGPGASTRGTNKPTHKEPSGQQQSSRPRAGGTQSRSLFTFPVTQPLKRRSMPISHTSLQAPDPALQCCWCGHNMSRLCCQGWTTVVHMRERHH
ncbi:hypothetical protein AWENTII_012234 [Aspergillus wentii]